MSDSLNHTFSVQLPQWTHSLQEMEWQPGQYVRQGHSHTVPEIAIAHHGGSGIILLNTPRTINALTLPMVLAMEWQLQQWAAAPSVINVVVVGAGDRGLCSGGDIKKVRECLVNPLTTNDDAVDFWTSEYRLDSLTASYPKPYIPIMDGVTMGGGAGISVHGSLRVVTTTTQFAMPETIIGFFPDVGVMYELGNMPGQLGMYLALTGSVIGGADAIRLGVADVLVPQSKLDAVLHHAARGDLGALRALCQLGSTPTGPSLLDQRDWIDACFTGDDVTAMMEALRRRPEPAAATAADALAARSPWSLAVTAKALRRAATASSVDAVLQQDAYLAKTFMEHPDFQEGVRARLVDKGSTPVWQHPTPADVPQHLVTDLFANGPLPLL